MVSVPSEHARLDNRDARIRPKGTATLTIDAPRQRPALSLPGHASLPLVEGSVSTYAENDLHLDGRAMTSRVDLDLVERQLIDSPFRADASGRD